MIRSWRRSRSSAGTALESETPGDVPVGMEHDRGRHDRAGEAAAPHFVDPGDVQNPTRRSAFSSVRMAGTRTIGQVELAGWSAGRSDRLPTLSYPASWPVNS